jgi:hypothetical protein
MSAQRQKANRMQTNCHDLRSRLLRLLCLTCEVLARPAYLCAAHSPHVIDVELLRYGLHNNPTDLRGRLQARIDAAAGTGYDAVLLGYGLCGKATAGLTAREVPLVIPRAHDCITLFLGNRDRYMDQFENKPGTYWYAQDYIERHDPGQGALSLGADVGPSSDADATYAEYVAKYGKDNADYLMEVMGAWQQHYQRAAYVDLGIGDGHNVETQAQEEAGRRGWQFEKIAGDIVLIRRLLNGDWADDFLVLAPGESTAMSYDSDVICPHADPANKNNDQ